MAKVPSIDFVLAMTWGGNGNTALLKEHVPMGIHSLNDKHRW